MLLPDVRMLKRGVRFCLFLLLLSGCVPVAQSVSPLPTATVTVLPSPTITPSPTPTATPTAIPTPVPTVSLGFLVAETPVVPAAAPTVPLLLPTPLPDPAALPGRVIPDPCGVNIHFTTPDPGELALLKAGGFRFVRMDLFWHLIEREKGQYDFSEYDALVATMTQQGIRIIFILDYGNDLYGGGGAPHYSEEGLAAFARFAAAAARRYPHKDVIWEIWNEPNLEKYWHAPADPVQYAQVAATVVAAIRRADPTAWIVGPATSGFPWDYITALAAQGVLNRLDAVTVHPYRLDEPESVWGDYLRLREILDRASPDRRIPIVSSEWGYPTVEGVPETEQAQYLTRQWLFHLASDVDLSIWYDWRNDGEDPHDVQANFGTVTYNLVPKPAYLAAQTLNETLNGYQFQRRLPLGGPADYVLLFRKGNQIALAAWTPGEAHTIALPLPCDTVDVVEMTGETGTLTADEGQFTLQLQPSPRYLHLCDSEMLLRSALWRPTNSIHTLSAEGVGRVLVEIENPFHETLQGELQVLAEGQVLGTAMVRVRPGELAKVSVPVTVADSVEGVLPAVVVFSTPDSLPLQSAVIWLIVL